MASPTPPPPDPPTKLLPPMIQPPLQNKNTYPPPANTFLKCHGHTGQGDLHLHFYEKRVRGSGTYEKALGNGEVTVLKVSKRPERVRRVGISNRRKWGILTKNFASHFWGLSPSHTPLHHL